MYLTRPDISFGPSKGLSYTAAMASADQGVRSAHDGPGLDGGRGGSHTATPRALAMLDAALRSGRCDLAELSHAVVAQKGRRGIVKVRRLLPLANGRAESPMESEARLVMIDGGLPSPVLQYEVVDARGRLRRLDFAGRQPGCRRIRQR